jgi:hypothetical protein
MAQIPLQRKYGLMDKTGLPTPTSVIFKEIVKKQHVVKY